MRNAAQRTADPDLILADDPPQKCHRRKADKPAGEGIEHRHQIPGEDVAKENAYQQDPQRLLPAEREQRIERDQIAQPQLHARHPEGQGDLTLQNEDRQCNGREQGAPGQPVAAGDHSASSGNRRRFRPRAVKAKYSAVPAVRRTASSPTAT